MQTRTRGIGRAGAVLLMAGSLAACMDKQDAPGLIGPAGTAQHLTMSASPDRIAHNGNAQSVVTVAMTDDNGQPVVGHRVSVGASTGFLSHLDVVTASDGRASFIVMAPALSTPANEITVFATPFGSDADSALTRSLKIALTGTLNATAPTGSFVFAPEAPVEGNPVVFDASATTDEGQPCLNNCAYSWDFGGLGAGVTDGMVVTRNQVTRGTHAVTLTVTDNAGTVGTRTLLVTVAAPPAVSGP
ncbi:MAG TPA: PKD domain-containing protein [Vicinamibacterales bacterium]|nr:PKD domain-containing protein [Vicinamibacterales bacterium]